MTVAATQFGQNRAAIPLGVWLMVASEAMLFVGISAGCMVLRSGHADEFAGAGRVIGSTTFAITAGLLLIAAVALQSGRGSIRFAVALLCFLSCIGISAGKCRALLRHHTVVAYNAATGRVDVYDGIESGSDANFLRVRGAVHAAMQGEMFDAHTYFPPVEKNEFQVDRSAVRQDLAYGPAKNNVFAFYFLLVAAHSIHVAGGAAVLIAFLFIARQRQISRAAVEGIAIYGWFLFFSWVLMFPILSGGG